MSSHYEEDDDLQDDDDGSVFGGDEYYGGEVRIQLHYWAAMDNTRLFTVNSWKWMRLMNDVWSCS